MANNYKTNPVYLDTWGADATIFTGPVTIKSVVFHSDTAGDTLSLEDKDGNIVVHCSIDTNNQTVHLGFGGQGVKTSGLVLDVSDGTYNTAFALIYV